MAIVPQVISVCLKTIAVKDWFYTDVDVQHVTQYTSLELAALTCGRGCVRPCKDSTIDPIAMQRRAQRRELRVGLVCLCGVTRNAKSCQHTLWDRVYVRANSTCVKFASALNWGQH